MAGGTAIALTASVMSTGDAHDETAINAALLANKKVRLVKDAVISAPIIINSGNTLEVADGVTIKVADGITTGINMLKNRAASTVQRTISDGAVASGSKSFTSASITTADTGRSVIIPGAATGGTHLCAKIVSAVAGTATLDVAAAVTVSAASARFYDRDKSIVIRGGTFDRNASGGAVSADPYGFLTAGHSMLLRRIDGLVIDGVSFKSIDGKYAISTGDVTNVCVYDPHYAVASDGFHIQGPASDVRVYRSRGSTGDDPCAVTGTDYATYADVQGDVYNVEFIDTKMDSNEGRILFAGGNGFKVRGAKVRGLSGGCSSGVVIAAGRNDPRFVPAFDSDVGGVELFDIAPDVPDTKYGVLINAELARDVKIHNHQWVSTANFVTNVRVDSPVEQLIISGTVKPKSVSSVGHYGVYVGPLGVVDSLIMSDTSIDNVTGSYLAISVLVGGWVKSFEVYGYSCINQTYTASGNGFIQTEGTGKIDRLLIDGLHEINAKALLTTAVGSTVGPVVINGFHRTGCSRIANVLCALDVTLGAGTNLSPIVEPFYVSGAELTIRGGGGYFDSLSKDGVVRAGSEVVRVMNFDFPVDTAKVAANAGDRHYNTNVASGSLKVGPCIYSGAAWKSLLNIA